MVRRRVYKNQYFQIVSWFFGPIQRQPTDPKGKKPSLLDTERNKSSVFKTKDFLGNALIKFTITRKINIIERWKKHAEDHQPPFYYLL